MSWSIHTEGTKAEVRSELDKQFAGYTGPSLSQAEFAECKPLIEALLEEHGDGPIRLEANGHATPEAWDGGVDAQIKNRTQTTISIHVWRT